VVDTLYSKRSLDRSGVYVGKSCQMINTVAHGVLGRNRSLLVDRVLRSVYITRHVTTRQLIKDIYSNG